MTNNPASVPVESFVGVVGGVPPGSEGGVCLYFLSKASLTGLVSATVVGVSATVDERSAGGLYGCRGDEAVEDAADDVRSRV